MKILFVGHPGSGKTYAASRLAKLTDISAIDIDDLLHNLILFFFTRPYRKSFWSLLENKSDWIIDGYAGRRMPIGVWDVADKIVFINLPKAELRRNIWCRYKFMRSHHNHSHGQHLFVNVIKNLWQIYLHDHSLRKRIQLIKSSKNVSKLSEVRSREELTNIIDSLASGK